MPSFAKLEARITPDRREFLDFLWLHFLRNNAWPSVHDVHRDFLEKRELDQVLAKVTGALVLKDDGRYILRPLGILATTKGRNYRDWLRSLITHLRDLYYTSPPLSFNQSDVQQALSLSEGDARELGCVLQHGQLFGLYAVFQPNQPGWTSGFPKEQVSELPKSGPIDSDFKHVLDDLARQAWHVDPVQRAQAMFNPNHLLSLMDDETSPADVHGPRRYQVFVSSTYEDLKEERRAVMQALLESHCIPVGMELFPAANAQQWKLIQKVIDESDYYIVIVAGRYGLRPPRSTKSYTEREFDYARKRKLPILAFYHEDPGSIPSKACETSTVQKRRLGKFTAKVKKGRMCKSWIGAAALASAVKTSIQHAITEDPRPGWIRASR